MHYTTTHCMTSVDFFRKFNKKKIKLLKKEFCKAYKADDKQELSAKVFTYCLYLIMLDIINNNVIFALPSVFGNDSEIAMKTFQDEEFKKVYRLGKFNDIDFLQSGFKGYQIFYNYESNGNVKEKPIYINHKLKDIITKKVNNGKIYF